MESLQVRNSNFGRKNSALTYVRQSISQKSMTSIKHRMAVQKTLDVISLRIQDPPSLGELACSAGLSRTYFSLLFKEVAGVRLQDYLSKIRINKAKDLLGDMHLTIKQISYEVGFRDPDYFSRTFKKKTGITPTNWRLRNVEEFLNDDKIKRRKIK